MSELLLTTKEAAEIMQCSASHMLKLIKTGEVHGVDMGGGKQRIHWKVVESSVQAYKKEFDKSRGSRKFRQYKPKSEACLPAVQGEMFVGVGIKEAQEKLLAEAEKQTELLKSIDAGQGFYESMSTKLTNIECDIGLIRSKVYGN